MGEIRSRRWKAPRWSQGLQGPPCQESRQRRRVGHAGPAPRVGPTPWSRVPPGEQDGAGCASRKGPMEAVALSNAARFRMGNNPRGASAALNPRGGSPGALSLEKAEAGRGRGRRDQDSRPVPAGRRQPRRAPVWPPHATAPRGEQSRRRRRGRQRARAGGGAKGGVGRGNLHEDQIKGTVTLDTAARDYSWEGWGQARSAKSAGTPPHWGRSPSAPEAPVRALRSCPRPTLDRVRWGKREGRIASQLWLRFI